MVKPNAIWYEVQGDFLCSCEGPTTPIDDCMLPLMLECESCHKVWQIAPVITESAWVPRRDEATTG